MNLNVKLWLVLIIASVLMGFLMPPFIVNSYSESLLALIVSLIVYYVFRKDKVNLIKTGLLISAGSIVLFAISTGITVYMSSKLAMIATTTPSAASGLAELFANPITAIFPFIVALIFFNLPLVLKEKFPERSYSKFIWITAVVLSVLTIVLVMLREFFRG